jgi:hypothetical protein
MAKHNIWTEPEIDLLKSWVGKKPIQQIQEEWNAVAKKKGWRERSRHGINVKANRLFKGIGFGTTRDGWSIHALARALDITHTRVIKWQRKGLEIKGYSHDACRPHVTAISRRDLKVFALAYPECFHSIDPKRLSKVFRDREYVHLIGSTEINYRGFAITIVRLDSGSVYQSVAAAGANLNLSPVTILDCANRDTPMRNGMDWARLDYPIYLVPRTIRDEFNQVAGKALYELYLQLRSVDGYSKTSCLIVAGRIAVQITLWAFNKNIKQKTRGEDLSPKQMIVRFWQEKWLELINAFLPLSGQQSWRKITSVVKHRAYSAFVRFLGCDRRRLDLYLEEYEILKLYLDLKLEECSDREVASAMNIAIGDVEKIEQKIKYLASTYVQK